MYCQICLEKYNTANRIPKNLACGHTFCDKCLKKLGSGYEIECPKCRQKSKNNLPICYAIYEHLLLEYRADIDEPCKIHEYEKLQFFCNIDKCRICAICLSSIHQGHIVSSLKDKILADDNQALISNWNNYFLYKKEEYYSKREKLSSLMKELDFQKKKISRELNNNYEKLIDNFGKSKIEIIKEIEDLHMIESNYLRDIKNRIDEIMTDLSKYVDMNENIHNSFSKMSNQSILSINMEELNNQDKSFDKKIDLLLNEKSELKFKTIKWSEEVIFNKKEILLSDYLKDEIKLKNHIIFIGDSKDKIILNYDLVNRIWNKMEPTFGGDYDNKDYSSICQYNDDYLLITGGCVYSNYRNTASTNTYLVKIISHEQVYFSNFKQLLGGRFSHGSCVVKGIPYVFGGHNGITTLNSIEYFDEKESLWKQGSNAMIVEREIFAHCVIKNRYIYVFGGFNDTHLDTIEKYDTVQNRWRMISVKMKKTLQNSTAVTISDDQIALIGGYNGTMHKSIDILNLTTLCWTTLDKMRIPRRRSHCYQYDDKLFIFGGEGTEVDQHIPEILDLKNFNMSFLESFDLTISKSMNFWCSTMIL